MLEIGFVGPIRSRGYSFLRYLDELSAALEELPDFRVSYIAKPDGPEQERQPSSFLPRRIAGRARRRVERWMRRRPPSVRVDVDADVYHLVAPGDALIIPRLPHGRVVVTIHDLLSVADWGSDSPGAGHPPRPNGRSRKYFATLGTAGHLACVSESTRAEVLEYVDIDPARVSVVPNGLDPRFRPLDAGEVQTARDALPPARFRVLQVSSTTRPRKNTGTVLRVLRRLRDHGLDVRLVRAGASLSPEDLRIAADLDMLDSIDDLGRISDRELVRVYNVADVLLFPSLYEGFGWPPLEAMACGTPVVASDIAACREVVGDAGFLVAPTDVDGLSERVASLLLDSDLARTQRQSGLERAQQFGWQRAALSLGEVYRGLL